MKNILVIDDSKTINNFIKKELTKLDFKVSQAFTLSDSKSFLKDNKYDLIILDLHLPDGEGSELIAQIQSLTKTKVVVLTSSQDVHLREELFHYGILDYIIKDTNLLYSIAEIVKIIDNISNSTKEKILIIDDSKFICKQIRTILEPRNYEVEMVYDAISGLEKISKNSYNLVILDMELPDMHGIRVLSLIRKNKNFLDIPIIVLSGTSTPETIREVLKKGANDFLKKPFVFEEFILKIDLWIDYHKKGKELKTKTKELEFVNKNLEKIVFQKVQENMQKDKLMFVQSRHAQMGEMISMIAHQWRQPLNSISNASNIINLKMNLGTLNDEILKDITSKIDDYVRHLSATIDDFRDFFKPKKDMIETDFEKIFAKAYKLMGSSFAEKDINIDVKSKNIATFCSYENELVQVILNLLKNSQDAFEDKEIKKKNIDIFIYENIFRIRDNAGGIPKDILDKIFDPYFSTKLKKDGTGLGLYMSKIIIQEHCRGSLNVQNIDAGVEFKIVIPKLKKR